MYKWFGKLLVEGGFNMKNHLGNITDDGYYLYMYHQGSFNWGKYSKWGRMAFLHFNAGTRYFYIGWNIGVPYSHNYTYSGEFYHKWR